MTKALDLKFIGTGDVKGFKFSQIHYTELAYVYKVDDGDGNVCFEVFKRKTAPICIDFEKRIYSETERKEYYPKSKDFGVWAWTYKLWAKAAKKMVEI
jgi:hypothetical protein